MFEKFKINAYNVLIIIGLCFLLLSKLDSSVLSTDFIGSDLLFLHNRVMQLRTCILDGNFLGMFFYNDFLLLFHEIVRELLFNILPPKKKQDNISLNSYL